MSLVWFTCGALLSAFLIWFGWFLRGAQKWQDSVGAPPSEVGLRKEEEPVSDEVPLVEG